MPASSRIRVRLDATQLPDVHGGLVDAARDGIPGGWAKLRHDTMNFSTVPATPVSGYVFDAESEPGPNGPRNQPPAGVAITVDGSGSKIRIRGAGRPAVA